MLTTQIDTTVAGTISLVDEIDETINMIIGENLTDFLETVK